MSFIGDANDQSFDHEMRGRPGRCTTCGAPTSFGLSRCLRCAMFGGGPVPESLPPLDGVGEATETPAQRHEAQMKAHRARMEWITEWTRRWAVGGEPRPFEFLLDRRCRICCEVINEAMAGEKVLPTQVGYRCAFHSESRYEDFQEID